jgi:mono/diheme cytochrome c family protein
VRRRDRACLTLFLLLVLTTWKGLATGGDQTDHPAKSEMHHREDWRFTLPEGDPTRGREVFMKFECYSCHQVVGEMFPEPGGEAVGPELSQMAPLHPLEYFASAVMNPGAVIREERSRAEDSRSKMPSFNDVMTVEELIDLAAFLKSLGGQKSTPSQVEHGH